MIYIFAGKIKMKSLQQQKENCLVILTNLQIANAIGALMSDLNQVCKGTFGGYGNETMSPLTCYVQQPFAVNFTTAIQRYDVNVENIANVFQM
jgi:hypothetical protein